MNSGPGEVETGALKIGLAALAGAIHDRDCRIWMAMTELWRLRCPWQNYCLLKSPKLKAQATSAASLTGSSG